MLIIMFLLIDRQLRKNFTDSPVLGILHEKEALVIFSGKGFAAKNDNAFFF